MPVVAPLLPQGYAARPEVQAFVDEMVQKHGFEREALLAEFLQVSQERAVLAAIQPAADPGVRSWQAYRGRFLDRQHVRKGLVYWRENAAALKQASARFGVPPEIMLAIIGVETYYGRVQGRFTTFSALATLAFDYPPRSDLFRHELEELLLLARESHVAPLSYTGSYAGALGQCQFLPSNVRKLAMDGNGDGRIDLAGEPADAIASVGSYLASYGWQKGGRVALRVRPRGQSFLELVDGGVEPKYGRRELQAHGLPVALRKGEKAAVIDLVTPRKATEYWLGFQNFYVITRYNKSSFYAMAVFQLAEKLRWAHARGRGR